MNPVCTLAGRPRIFDEHEALTRARDLFWDHGYAATSTDDLMQAMGLQRGSFYHAFGSKRDLYVAALNFHEEGALAEFQVQMKSSEAPVEALKAAFLAMAECGEQEHMLGCFAGNTIAELSGIDEELVQKACRHLKKFEAMIRQQIRLSQRSGELKTKVDAALLARYLLNLWNGLNITRRMYPDKKVLKELIAFQLEAVR